MPKPEPREPSTPNEQDENSNESLGQAELADQAAHRLEERGEPLPDTLQAVIDESRAEVREILNEDP